MISTFNNFFRFGLFQYLFWHDLVFLITLEVINTYELINCKKLQLLVLCDAVMCLEIAGSFQRSKLQ